jgi:hypothetical protein
MLASERDVFARTGLFVLPGVFTGAQLDSLHRRARRLRLVAQREDYATRHWFRTTPPAERSDPEIRARASWGLDQLEREELLDVQLVGVFGEPKIDGILKELFGHQPLARLTTLLWAPRLAPYDLHWHRDLLPLDLYDTVATKPPTQDHVRFYVALRRDRSLRYVPGSHRRPLEGPEREVAAARRSGPFDGEVRLELQPGDVAFFDPHLFHRAHAEAGDERLTLLYSVQAAWIPLAVGPFAEHVAWLTSEDFLGRLDPVTRGYYAALQAALLQGDPFGYLRRVAQ